MKLSTLTVPAALAVALLAVVGCDEGPGPGAYGPCVHTYEEPLLWFDQAVDSETGQELYQLEFAGVRLDGAWLDLEEEVDREVATGVALIDGTLVCELPCGFGTQAGEYALFVSAEGYEDLALDLDADYEVFVGGCPSSNSGGLDLELELQPR